MREEGLGEGGDECEVFELESVWEDGGEVEDECG